MPNGAKNDLNYEGIQYYHRLIDELVANGIEPVVTMYHLDLPQKLQDLGGWANSIIVDYYEGYADVLFREYGSKVTVNSLFMFLLLNLSKITGKMVDNVQ